MFIIKTTRTITHINNYVFEPVKIEQNQLYALSVTSKEKSKTGAALSLVDQIIECPTNEFVTDLMEKEGLLFGDICILIENHAKNEDPTNQLKKYRQFYEEFKEYSKGFEDYSYNQKVNFILQVHEQLKRRNIDNKISKDTSGLLDNNLEFIKENTDQLFKLCIITDFIFNYKKSKTVNFKKMADWLLTGETDCNIYAAMYLDFGKTLGLDIKPVMYYGHATTYLKLSNDQEIFIETRTGLFQNKEYYNISEYEKSTLIRNTTGLITTFFEENCLDYFITRMQKDIDKVSTAEYKKSYEKAQKYLKAALGLCPTSYLAKQLNFYLLLIDLDKSTIESEARDKTYPKKYLQITYNILEANKYYFIDNAQKLHPKRSEEYIESKIDEILASIKKILDTEK